MDFEAHVAGDTPTAGRDVFRFDKAVLVEDPYPHLVIEDALAPDIATTLLNAMPPVEVFTRDRPPGSNVRFALPSHIGMADARPSSAWKEAITICNAALPALLASMLDRLGDRLLRVYPDFPARFAPLGELRAIPRAEPGRQSRDIGVDAQMVINTPALEGGTSVRGPHLDQPDKLISGLLYLRAADDTATGGELELYAADAPLTFNDRNETSWEKVRLVHRYPYRHNLLILPLNTPNALHGVSPRSATLKPRYHLHLVGELSAPLFTIPH